MRTDSTRHREVRGDRLRISHDLLQDPAWGNLPDTGGGRAISGDGSALSDSLPVGGSAAKPIPFTVQESKPVAVGLPPADFPEAGT
jgi:hypothetical protein